MACTPGCHVDSAGSDGASAAPFGPHGSNHPSLTAYFEETMCGNCHTEVGEMNNANTPTHHHVVDSEQGTGRPVECATCHEPHVVKNSPWQPLSDPDTGNTRPGRGRADGVHR